MDDARFAEWALVEVMGRQSYVGFVTEAVIGGAAMVRIDVPAVEAAEHDAAIPAFTKYVGGGSIYAITPVSEEFAMLAVRQRRTKPHNLYVPELYPVEASRKQIGRFSTSDTSDEDAAEGDVVGTDAEIVRGFDEIYVGMTDD